MSKIMALDLGDVWVGIALSDSLRIIAKPFTTVKLPDLSSFLSQTLSSETIDTVIIGYPITLRGTQSEQTKKVISYKEQLATEYPHINFVLWDERLSSKQAMQGKKIKTKEDKQAIHARAAAFVLDSYLTFLRLQKAD